MRTLFLACVLMGGGWAQADTISAVLEPARSVELRSTVNGRIEMIAVREGEGFDKGATLARIDARVQKSRVALTEVVAQASGATQRAEQLLEQARTRRDRVVQARRQGAAQDWEVVAAEQAVALAEADVALAGDDHRKRQAELELERAKLEEFVVSAPFAATVLEVTAEAGEIVDTGTVLIEIGTVDKLSALAFVPLEWLDQIATGDSLFATDEGAREVIASVRSIDPRVDAASRTVRVMLDIDNPDGTIRAGTAIVVRRPE